MAATGHGTKAAVAESTCDACGESAGTLYGAVVGGGAWSVCAACLDEEIRTSGDAAPGCYCSGGICDHCAGRRVWGVLELSTPRAVQVAAERFRTRPLALSRWSTARLASMGFRIGPERLRAEAIARGES